MGRNRTFATYSVGSSLVAAMERQAAPLQPATTASQRLTAGSARNARTISRKPARVKIVRPFQFTVRHRPGPSPLPTQRRNRNNPRAPVATEGASRRRTGSVATHNAAGSSVSLRFFDSKPRLPGFRAMRLEAAAAGLQRLKHPTLLFDDIGVASDLGGIWIAPRPPLTAGGILATPAFDGSVRRLVGANHQSQGEGD
jgi:hypothetical protein